MGGCTSTSSTSAESATTSASTAATAPAAPAPAGGSGGANDNTNASKPAYALRPYHHHHDHTAGTDVCTMMRLPEAINSLICTYFPLMDFIRLSVTCRYWYHITQLPSSYHAPCRVFDMSHLTTTNHANGNNDILLWITLLLPYGMATLRLPLSCQMVTKDHRLYTNAKLVASLRSLTVGYIEPVMLSHLTNLTSLTIGSRLNSPPLTSDDTRPLSSLPLLTHLRANHTQYSSAAAILSLPPSLTSLELPAMKLIPRDIAPLITSLPLLRHLHALVQSNDATAPVAVANNAAAAPAIPPIEPLAYEHMAPLLHSSTITSLSRILSHSSIIADWFTRTATATATTNGDGHDESKHPATIVDGTSSSGTMPLLQRLTNMVYASPHVLSALAIAAPNVTMMDQLQWPNNDHTTRHDFANSKWIDALLSFKQLRMLQLTIDYHQLLSLPSSAPSMICDNGCASNKVAIVCTDCQQRLCHECNNVIHRGPTRVRHQRQPVVIIPPTITAHWLPLVAHTLTYLALCLSTMADSETLSLHTFTPLVNLTHLKLSQPIASSAYQRYLVSIWYGTFGVTYGLPQLRTIELTDNVHDHMYGTHYDASLSYDGRYRGSTQHWQHFIAPVLRLQYQPYQPQPQSQPLQPPQAAITAAATIASPSSDGVTDASVPSTAPATSAPVAAASSSAAASGSLTSSRMPRDDGITHVRVLSLNTVDEWLAMPSLCDSTLSLVKPSMIVLEVSESRADCQRLYNCYHERMSYYHARGVNIVCHNQPVAQPYGIGIASLRMDLAMTAAVTAGGGGAGANGRRDGDGDVPTAIRYMPSIHERAPPTSSAAHP